MTLWDAIAFIWSIYLSPNLPWNRIKRTNMGKKFVQEYSNGNDAKLSVWHRGQEFINSYPVTDRHYEYAYMFEQTVRFKIKKKKILDVGSAGSVLPLILSKFGNEAWCLDVIPWPLVMKGVRILERDLLLDQMPKVKFDAIYCLSTIEHVGLGRYGDSIDVNGDFKTMRKLKSLLKPKGLMFLTTEYGRPAVVYPMHRIYDKYRFDKLVDGFEVLDKQYFGPIEQYNIFRSCTEDETLYLDPSKGYSIVCVTLRKK